MTYPIRAPRAAIAALGMVTLLFMPPSQGHTAAIESARDDAREAAQFPALIGKAIDAADSAAFERLVDMNAILDTALNLFLRETQKPETARGLPPLLAFMLSRATLEDSGEGLHALILQEAKTVVNNGIASGAFAGHKLTYQAAQGLLAPLFADASAGRKEIRETDEAWPDKGEWLVPFILFDAGNNESYPVLGRVSKTGNGFRLTAIDNMDELVRRILTEVQHLTE
jgi:hypothetical protein